MKNNKAHQLYLISFFRLGVIKLRIIYHLYKQIKLIKMKKTISKNWYMQLLKGLIMVLMAILIFMDPEDALRAYTVYIGMGIALSGILILLKSLSERKDNPVWAWGVLEALMDLFIAYVLLSHPTLTDEVLPFVIGFWSVFYGLSLIISAFSGDGNMLLKLLSGILVFVLANIMMFNPLFAGLTFTIWVGVLFMIIGLYNVWIAFRFK